MFSQITQKYLPVDKLKTKGHKVYADLHGIYCDKINIFKSFNHECMWRPLLFGKGCLSVIRDLSYQ